MSKKREGRWRKLRAVPGKIIIYFVLIKLLTFALNKAESSLRKSDIR